MEIPPGGGTSPETALTGRDQAARDQTLQDPAGETPASGQTDPAGIIEIREKLFIAQTNDVYLNPQNYLGKIIKLEGLFKPVSYENGASYNFVLRYGPGCCGNDGTAGFEVAWDSPAEYPEEDEWVEAAGILDSYEEDGYPFLYLSLLSLEVKQERGAEFVSQ
jgi:uncharacterized membrane protein YcgQ (UPF0703/DUF1980 family)